MLSLRTATETDAAAIAALIRQAFERPAAILGMRPAEHPHYVAFDDAARVRRRMLAGVQTVLLCAGDAPIGTVSWSMSGQDSAEGELTRLAVLPAQRGQDHGRRLMQHAEAQLYRQGARIARISIVARFERLQAYHESMGYQAREIRRVASLPFDLLFLEKRLVARAPGREAANA
jgi:GNAT superfamily N-acetyltransferase